MDDDLDRIYSAIDKHIGLAKDEEGAAGVDEMLDAIERAGQIIAFAMKVRQRVRERINIANRCPLCNGKAPWGKVSHWPDCPMLEGAE